MVLTMLVVAGVVTFTVSAQQGPASIVEGVPDDIKVGEKGTADPTKVRFGGQEWLVIGYDGEGVHSTADDESMTLLLSADSDGYGSSIFNEYTGQAGNNYYSGSKLLRAMDDAYADIEDEREQGLVEPRDLEGGSGNYSNQNITNYDANKIAGDPVDDANFWPLSVEEADELDTSVLKFSAASFWWLRSPGDYNLRVAYVDENGGVYRLGFAANSYGGIRPAFRLNLDSVLFTSDVEGGKSDISDGISGITAGSNGDTVKFTMEDNDNQTLELTGVTTKSNGSSELEFPYREAATGENQYISAILVNENEEVAFYGKLADMEDADDKEGMVKLSLENVADGDYTLKIFSEQDNGKNYTDYAGSIHEYDLSVAGEKGTIGGGLGVDTSGGTLVYYGHNYMKNQNNKYADKSAANGDDAAAITWRIMEEETDSITVMSDKLLGYRAYHNDWMSGHQKWSGSDIANYLNDDFIEESFDSRESDIIGKYGEIGDINEGIDLDQQIVLPSVDEVNNGGWFNNNDDQKAYYADTVNGYTAVSEADDWWLRSPGSSSFDAAYVASDGLVNPNGAYVDGDYGIRPAFRLNLESVLFASDAVGGKSGSPGSSGVTVGSGLDATTVATDAVKLTVIDNTVAAPEITLDEDENENNKLKFTYTGATSGGQYISAVLVDEDGEVVYYGKLADCENNASGDFELSFTNVNAGTYTLKIFYEECHGDYETDYAGLSIDRKLVVLENGSFETDFKAPEVERIEPEKGAVDISINGTIKITFSEPIDTENPGTVTLAETDGDGINEETLTDPAWSESDTVYALDYSGLSHGTEYTITVDGFYDLAENEIAEPFTSTFTTEELVHADTPNITGEPEDTSYTLNIADNPLTVTASVTDTGNLSYQWYRNDNGSNTNGTAIDKATTASYTPPTDTVGIYYYYVVVTNTNTEVNGTHTAATTSRAVKVIVKEAVPDAAIDYERELLAGLEAGADYLFGTSETAVSIAATTYAIEEEWMNETELSIIRVSTVSECNSAPQKLTIPARPGVPEVSGVDETAEGAEDGKITETNNTMEYSTDIDETWNDCPDGDMENLSPGTYLIRSKAVEGDSFAGEEKTIVINAAVDAETPYIKNPPVNTSYTVGEPAETPLTVEVEALGDEGTLSYQWYRAADENDTSGEAITGENMGEQTNAYTPPTDTVGIYYYYVVVTNTNEKATGKKVVTTKSNTAKITVREAAPDAAIDYEEELLIGLIDGAEYLFGSGTTPETASGGRYAIKETWMGTELLIIRVSAAEGCDSDSQQLTIPARPAAPKVSGEDETAEGAEDGKITGTNNTMEYSEDGGVNWKDCPTGDMTGLSSGTWLIRYKAVKDQSFAGETKEVKIHAATDAQTPVISSHPQGADYMLNEQADKLEVEASVSDGGTLSYQWYRNENDSTDGASKIEGATDAGYRPSTDTEGTTYYYVEVTNTNTGVSGNQKATRVSNGAAVTVSMALTSSSGTATVGTEIAITPSAWEADGTWTYDTALLELLENSDGKGTFLPLLDGETTVTYENTRGITGTLQLKIKKGTMSGISADGWSGVYDGEPHSITVNGIPEGAMVRYSTDEKNWSDENPAYTEEDTEVTVYYRVEKAGYHPVSGSADIQIGDCEHNWEENDQKTPATCTEQGKQGYTCETCGKEKTEEIPAIGHRWGEVKTTSATCEKAGRTWHTCENCEEEETLEILLPTGHSWGDWYEVQAATEESEGSQRRDCEDCEEYQLRTIGKLEKLVLEGIPEHQTIRIGESFTLIPGSDDRTGSDGWEWDTAYFSATFNSPATFTALRAGISTITYTASDGRSISLDVTIIPEEETESESGTKPEAKPEDETQQTEKETGQTPEQTHATEAPATADTAPLRIWLILLMLGAIGISAAAIDRRRSRN